MKTELVVQRAVQQAGIPPDGDFHAWAAAALAGRDAGASLTIRIVNADESRRLNHAYRGKDSATNVLSFGADLPAGVVEALREKGEAPPLGDLVICAEVVAREAGAQGKPLAHHWAHLVVHGILHLAGLDHADAAAAGEMEDLERRLLSGLGIPDPYRAR